MKKVGIMTIYGLHNYGNRLQDYALQTVLKRYDAKVCTFINLRDRKKYSFTTIKRSIKRFLVNSIIKSVFLRKKYYKDIMRNQNFKRFNKFITFGEAIYANCNYKKLSSYDLFVAGSDQVWNPNFEASLYNNTLAFAPNEKKISIASSMAVKSLTDIQKLEFQKYLADFDCLSVREDDGARLLEDALGKKVESLVDPTLMLSSDEWTEVSKKPKFHDENKKYILLYFLGSITTEYKNKIDEIAKYHNLEIINIYDRTSNYFSCGPSEFIYMIKNCSIMLTDSFHGTIFSFIFDRPFKIFKRVDSLTSMISRLENIVKKFELKDAFFDVNMPVDNLLDINYKHQKERLKKEQEKFVAFIEKKMI